MCGHWAPAFSLSTPLVFMFCFLFFVHVLGGVGKSSVPSFQEAETQLLVPAHPGIRRLALTFACSWSLDLALVVLTPASS